MALLLKSGNFTYFHCLFFRIYLNQVKANTNQEPRKQQSSPKLMVKCSIHYFCPIPFLVIRCFFHIHTRTCFYANRGKGVKVKQGWILQNKQYETAVCSFKYILWCFIWIETIVWSDLWWNLRFSVYIYILYSDTCNCLCFLADKLQHILKKFKLVFICVFLYF